MTRSESGRRGSRPRLSAEERRQVIVDAASQTFAELGYVGASIDRIAEAAGVTAPVIYDHFGSKKDLYIALLEINGRRLLDATTRDEGLDSAEEILRTNTQAFFDFVRENRAAWRMLFLDPAPDPEIAAAQRALQARASRELAEVIVARVPKPKVSVRARRSLVNELIAEAGKSALNGLAVWWWDHPEVPSETLAAVAFDLLWTGLGNLGD